MDMIEICKILGNETRQNILIWLKCPEKHFPEHKEIGHFRDGVCVQYICQKAELSQSTISQYLISMQKAGLITPTRHGKWTYYKRNNEVVNNFIKFLKESI